MNEAQPLEYEMRLKTQALHDMQSRSLGISAGNLEGLRQIGVAPDKIAIPNKRDDVEKRYLEE